MASNEGAFWNRIVEALWSPRRFLLRIESGVSDGVPDSYLVIERIMGWVELKCPSTPARETTALFSGSHRLSQTQCNWLLAHRQAGGRAYVGIETEQWCMFIGARHADFVNKLTLNELIGCADWCAARPVKPEQWLRLLDVWRVKDIP